MILYLDTSACVKKYFQEKGSHEVISLWKEAAAIVTSSVAYAETVASFYRKKREGELYDRKFSEILDAFHKDWESFIRVELTSDLNVRILKLIASYPLRGFDAIHLASAQIIYEKVSDEFVFACFDQRLIQAARQEGIKTFLGEL